MADGKGQRKRAYAPKKRTGCRTCKARRIKCDEAKPFCDRCTSTGRKCDGYLTQQSIVQLKPVNILPKTTITTVIGNIEIESHLDFFSRNVAPKIAGFHGLEFWSTSIVQLAHVEPSIRMAIQAVTMLHHEVEKREGGTVPSIDAGILGHYNNAIRYMVQGSQDRPYINLIVVALFVCLEFLAGNEEAASIHINGGLKMLLDWQKKQRQRSISSSPSPPTSPPEVSTSASEDDLLNELGTAFSRLAVHSKVFGKRMLTLEYPSITSPSKSSYIFETMKDSAKLAFELLDTAIDFISRVTPLSYSDAGADQSVHQRQRQLQGQLQQWRKAHKDFIRNEQMNLSQVQVRTGNLLQALVLASYIWTSTCLTPYQEEYDKYTSEFREVVDLSRTIVEIPHDYLCENLGRFNIDMGLVPALHLVGSRCRIRSIREDAANQLGKHHWREGLFDSFRSAQFIKACMKLEDAANQRLMGLQPHETDDYLPCEGARIHFVGVDKTIVDGTQLHSFYSKPYGAFGDWHVQQCYLPASPTVADLENAAQSKIRSVPNSAYTVPRTGICLAPDSHGHRHDVWPEMVPLSTSQSPAPALSPDLLPTVTRPAGFTYGFAAADGAVLGNASSFNLPHDALKRLDEKSNGMFYYHLEQSPSTLQGFEVSFQGEDVCWPGSLP